MTDQFLPTRRRRGETTDRKPRRGVLYFLRDLAIIFIIAVLVSFLVKTFLIRSFYIPSGSMEHTLEKNDRIIVNELEPALIPIQRGDVVVFRDPGGWLPAKPEAAVNPVAEGIDWLLSLVGLSTSDSEDHLIKRVIGLPGDHVECCNALGQLSVNGSPLSEPYVTLPHGDINVSRDPFDVTVPKGSLWVMGDNRYNSADSRYNRDKPGNGFVPIEDVVGRALVISWPIDRWSWLDNYPDVFSGAETGEG